jgi:DNA (cytosine-5)-methyltransferase 1
MIEKTHIPVIDLFAGPGGLGEGFESFNGKNGKSAFKICLSIEKDSVAHQTLLTRSFYRQFPSGNAPHEYYKYLRGEISRNELFEKYPRQFEKAAFIAWKAELGITPHKEVTKKINEALNGSNFWVLIGGPPCQAYSLAGRSVMISKDRDKYENDPRHSLYKEYVQIIADHRPPVFIMENVKGLLSSTLNGSKVFDLIISDLGNPVAAANSYGKTERNSDTVLYDIYPLTRKKTLFGVDPRDFLIESENLGLPQKRHRVFLLGIRKDLGITPREIQSVTNEITTVEDVIFNLPHLRSGLSKINDTTENWIDILKLVEQQSWFGQEIDGNSEKIWKEMRLAIKTISENNLSRGLEFLSSNNGKLKVFAEWYEDEKIGGVINHTTRSHIVEDLYRYLFASCFAKVTGKSPVLRNFPTELLPLHKSADKGVDGDLFCDRFHVQVQNKPSSTVIAHISKDGHYFIHPDPTQCRSMTVREVARLQTFPDNYFFEGGRTSQYQQVGNAVPPLLARQIAGVVFDILHTAKFTPVSRTTQKKPKLNVASQIFYHGTAAEVDFTAFNSDLVYLAPNQTEAKIFATNPILAKGKQGKPKVLAIYTKAGKVKNIDKPVMSAIDSDSDVDNVINIEARKARLEGYRYLEFEHPGTRGSFYARVAIYPNEDLEIKHKS